MVLFPFKYWRFVALFAMSNSFGQTPLRYRSRILFRCALPVVCWKINNAETEIQIFNYRQMQSPHRRQWCRRNISVKSFEQITHWEQLASGVQSGGLADRPSRVGLDVGLTITYLASSNSGGSSANNLADSKSLTFCIWCKKRYIIYCGLYL